MATITKHEYSKNAYQVKFPNSQEMSFFSQAVREFYDIATAAGPRYSIILIFNDKATPSECEAFFRDTRLYQNRVVPSFE